MSDNHPPPQLLKLSHHPWYLLHRQPPPTHPLHIYMLFTNYIWSIPSCITTIPGGCVKIEIVLLENLADNHSITAGHLDN